MNAALYVWQELEALQDRLSQLEQNARSSEDKHQREKSRQLDSLRLCRIELEEMEREAATAGSVNNNHSPFKMPPGGVQNGNADAGSRSSVSPQKENDTNTSTKNSTAANEEGLRMAADRVQGRDKAVNTSVNSQLFDEGESSDLGYVYI